MQEQRGTVSIEFLLWVPFFAFWMMASVAIYDAWMSRNQAFKVAHTLADMLSRQEILSPQFLFQIDALQMRLLSRATGTGTLRVSSVQRVQDDNEVLWSCVNDPAIAPLTPGTIPANLLPAMADLDAVIVVELSVPWTRFAGTYGLDAYRWETRVSTASRFTPQLQMDGSCN